MFSEFGQKPVRPGDVILLGPNVLCGSEPEGHITVTTIYADTDYVIDQAFWQYAGIVYDRLDAPVFVKETFTEPAQIIRLGEQHAGLLMPWLDELVGLSLDDAHARFHRMQALWFNVMDRIAPHIRVTDHRVSPSQRARSAEPAGASASAALRPDTGGGRHGACRAQRRDRQPLDAG
ncbi:hypothetical protein [Brevibacterium sp. FAM 24630]|uniref:hypothetical protein n=1 Tax=Brevibacterium sp. FAM 24630 TaxID=3415680 RepID=UPI003C7DAC4F